MGLNELGVVRLLEQRSLGDLAVFVEDRFALAVELGKVRNVGGDHATDDVHLDHVGDARSGHDLVAETVQEIVTILFLDPELTRFRVLQVVSQGLDSRTGSIHENQAAARGGRDRIDHFADFFEVNGDLGLDVSELGLRNGFLEPEKGVAEDVRLVVERTGVRFGHRCQAFLLLNA